MSLPLFRNRANAQYILERAGFFASLTKSLVLDKGVGSPTYTRATTATVTDHEGALRTAISGEARFQGARRVYNKVPASEDLTNAGWTKVAGSATAGAFTENSTNAIHYVLATGYGVPIGSDVIVKFRASIASGSRTIWCGDGTKVAEFNLSTGATSTTGAGVTATATVVSVGVYDCTAKIVSATAANILIGQANGFGNFTYTGDGSSSTNISRIQIEDVTGQSVQAAGDYVSVGALDYRSTQNPLYLSLPGTINQFANSPDSVVSSVTGDIAVVVRVAMQDWTPAAASDLLTKWLTTGNQRSYGLELAPTGAMNWSWSTLGTAVSVSAKTSSVPGFVDGSINYVAVTHDVDNGAGGNDVKFWTSQDGSTWTQLGSTATTAGTTSFFDSTALLNIGAYDAGALGNAAGNFYSAQVYSGIPPMFGGSGSASPVVDFNPHRDATTPTGTITSSTTGEVWTINGASSVVRSAAYHGSCVDGVKCFSTDLDGSLIPAATNMGYVAEGARTNLCLQSQTFNNASWSVLDAAVTANQAIAPDGTTTADLLAEAATTAVHIVYPSLAITVTAGAVYTASVYAKAGTRSWLCVYEDSGGGTIVWFDLANGAVGTAIAATATIESAGNGWYRCAVTYTQSGTAARIRFAVASGNGVVSYAGTITNNIYLWGAQVELGSFASTYIPTTTVAVTRNADVLTYPSAGNVLGTSGWAYVEMRLADITSTAHMGLMVGTAGVGAVPYTVTTSAVRMYDGANVVSGGNGAINTQLKVASTWGGSGQAQSLNGATAVTGSFDGSMNTGSSIYVGIDSDGTSSPLFGTIRNVRIWQVALSSSQLQAITA